MSLEIMGNVQNMETTGICSQFQGHFTYSLNNHVFSKTGNLVTNFPGFPGCLGNPPTM